MIKPALNSTQTTAGETPFTQIMFNYIFFLLFRTQGTCHDWGVSAYVPRTCRNWEGLVPPIQEVPTGTPQPWTKLGGGRAPQRGPWWEDAAAAAALSSSASFPTPRAGTPRGASARGFSPQGMGYPHPASQNGNCQAHPAPARGDVRWDNSPPLPPSLCMSTAGYLFIFMSFLQPAPIVKA